MAVEGARSARRDQLPARQGNSSFEFFLLSRLLHHLSGTGLNGLAELGHPEKTGTLDWMSNERWKDVDRCVFLKATVTNPENILQE